MRDNIKASLQRVMQKGFDFHAGDLVVWYASQGDVPAGVNLLTLNWNDARASAEGVQIFAAGIEEEDWRPLVFLKSYLDAQSIVLTAQGHFTINGERYDFIPDRPIVSHGGSSEDTTTLVWCMVRKASESEHTAAGTEFGFNLGD